MQALLDDGQWAEAIERLRSVAETSAGRLVWIGRPTDGFRRGLPVEQVCQILLSGLKERSPEALRVYRRQIDSLAQQRFRQALAVRDVAGLRQIVDELFLSSSGDDACWWLGELEFERGHTTAARAVWQRLSLRSRLRSPAGSGFGSRAGYPVGRLLAGSESGVDWAELLTALRERPLPRGWLVYPDSDLDPDAVDARLALVSLLDGDTVRAEAEIALLQRVAPGARGNLAGRSGLLVSLLQELSRQAEHWASPPVANHWLTFGGAVDRNGRVRTGVDVGGRPIWQFPLPRRSIDEIPPALLGYHPLIRDGVAVLQYGAERDSFVSLDLEGGQLVGGTGFAGAGTEAAVLSSSSLAQRFTATWQDDYLYACLHDSGGPMTRLVAFDVLANFKLVLDIRLAGFEWEGGGWRFAGAPLAAGGRLYLALQRSNQVRPETYAACFDARRGDLVWRRFVCASDATRQLSPLPSHNLVTLHEETLYCNTNQGVVAALRAGDGRPQWVVQYPRVDLQQEDPDRNELHLRRDLNPCLVDGDRVFVAPRDSPELFCLDAITGTLLWATQAADVRHLLGVRGDQLLASGECLYWFDARTGRLQCRFPAAFHAGESLARPAPRGFGRGLLVGHQVWWPTRAAIYVFRLQTIKTESGPLPDLVRRIDLAGRGAVGGNLAMAGGVLLIAGPDRLTAFNEVGTLVYE